MKKAISKRLKPEQVAELKSLAVQPDGATDTTDAPEVLDWSDEQVSEVVGSELQRVLDSETKPEPVALVRHEHALPQYNIGHERWVASLREELQRTPGVFVTANYLDGASVPACIEQADRTAHRVAEYLRRNG